MDSYDAKENTNTTKSIRFHPVSLSWYLIDSIWLCNTIHEFQGKGAQIQEYSGRVFVSSFQELHVGENDIPLLQYAPLQNYSINMNIAMLPY